ncbi:MAG: hypothetical protein LBD67_02280 [Candidatus Accumulibacter sp.]|nr:hypothetical protein [Accumulibacter sp.]
MNPESRKALQMHMPPGGGDRMGSAANYSNARPVSQAVDSCCEFLSNRKEG